MRKFYRSRWFTVSLSVFVTLGAVCQAPDTSNQLVTETTEGESIEVAEEEGEDSSVNSQSSPSVAPETRFFSTQQLAGIDSHLEFSATIPSEWEVEYIPEIQSMNFFDPLAEGSTHLDQSQIFVRYFVANEFLTLQTVTIHSRTESTLQGRPAVTYDIEKKSGVPDFPSQPSWRNQRHLVTDIRSTDASPTVFYVFGVRPGLDTSVAQNFLESVALGPQEELVYFPMEQFTQQATKKFFGTYITTATSPIQPERFSGFHTGVDVETTEAQQSIDVPIYAWTKGVLTLKQDSDGYGGVMALESSFQGETYTGIYGHVRLSSVTAEVGEEVTPGEQLGVLGTGYSSETDGERKHLHFALLKGSSSTLLGYVQSESQLDQWIDPLEFFQTHQAVHP